MVGASICGQNGNADPELCTRWTNLGSLYPYARNHNGFQTYANDRTELNTYQEPYKYMDKHNPENLYHQTTYGNVQKKFIQQRYNLINYFYTELHKVAENGGTVWKPVFFEFQTDSFAYLNPEGNFMIGPAIKVSFDAEAKEETAMFHLPEGRWCHVFDYIAHRSTPCFRSMG